MSTDIREVVVVNESYNPNRVGDVSLFKNIADAERYFEAVDVKNGEYSAFLLDGRGLKLLVVDDRVRVEPEMSTSIYHDRIRSILEAAGSAVLAARKGRGQFEDGLNPSVLSTVELIQLIGFAL
ncbi:MAG: hypothetical protein KGM15_15715 [Pseudomonadota bacterium]|nr:hypothetical protein [Pseudomonadota bacterium]